MKGIFEGDAVHVKEVGTWSKAYTFTTVWCCSATTSFFSFFSWAPPPFFFKQIVIMLWYVGYLFKYLMYLYIPFFYRMKWEQIQERRIYWSLCCNTWMKKGMLIVQFKAFLNRYFTRILSKETTCWSMELRKISSVRVMKSVNKYKIKFDLKRDDLQSYSYS